MTWPPAKSEFRSFMLRILYLPVPVYVVTVIIWRFALHNDWVLSLGGIPLALFIGGVIYCLYISLLNQRKRQRL